MAADVRRVLTPLCRNIARLMILAALLARRPMTRPRAPLGRQQLPLLPFIFELVGISYSGYFVYRYLLFKPDREELGEKIDDIKSKIF